MKFTTAFEDVRRAQSGYGTDVLMDAEKLSTVCGLLDACQLIKSSDRMVIRINAMDCSVEADDPIFDAEADHDYPSSVTSSKSLYFYEYRKESGTTWSGGDIDLMVGADMIVFVSEIHVGFDVNIGRVAEMCKAPIAHTGAMYAMIDMLIAKMKPLYNYLYTDGITESDFYRMEEMSGGYGNYTYWAPQALRVNTAATSYDHTMKADGLVIKFIAYRKVLLGPTEQAPWGNMYQYRTYRNSSGDRWYYRAMA